MKKLILALSFLVANLGAGAQTTPAADSSKVKSSITLYGRHHYYLIAQMDAITEARQLAYVSQVVAQTEDTLAVAVETPITVEVEDGLIADLYLKMGDRREATATVPNSEIKDLLIPQVYTHTWLMRQLGAVQKANQDAVNAIVAKGHEFCRRAKQ